MGIRRGYVGWIGRPQALVCFVAISLCIGALHGWLRPIPSASSLANPNSHVYGATTPELAPPNCSTRPCIALTFDDGPDSTTTPQVLDILARQEVKATFFVVGSHIAGREALLQRQHREGHEIGNHTWNHPDLSKLSPADVDLQIRATQDAVIAAGVPMPHLLRPPYGAIDERVAGRIPLTIVRWNIDPEDWKDKNAVNITTRVLTQAKPGGIILLHDTSQATASALEPAIIALKPYYHFVTASQLLNLAPGDQGQYFGRTDRR